MDKYEFNIKVDEIKRLAARKSYKQAAEIARDMNWNKVKDWSTLATVINVQEAVEDYEEARDMAILAYNRNLGGRRLLYKLTEILIKLEQFEDAEELYDEYEKAAPHSSDKFILFYDLRKAQKASDNELVEILEGYKEHEGDEKYLLELAKLYAKTGRNEECIKTCDDIILYFQDGIYVEQALKLKKDLGVELTLSQKRIYDDLKKKKHDIEATKEILFEEQKKAAMHHDDIEEAMAEDDADRPLADEDNDSGLLSFFKKFKNTSHENEDDDFGIEEQKAALKEDLARTRQLERIEQEPETVKEEPKSKTSKKAKSHTKGKKQSAGITDSDTKELNTVADNIAKNEPLKADAGMASNIDKVSNSLQEMVEQAKKKLENNYQEYSKEESLIQQAAKSLQEAGMKEHTVAADGEQPQEKAPVQETAKADTAKKADETKAQKSSVMLQDTAEINDIQVDIPNFDNPYNTQNLQTVIAENLNEFLRQEKEEADSLRPQPMTPEEAGEENPEDEQIEGQLNLADWLETVREEKYGKQNTREFSKSELERMLDEKDEKSAAYEKMVADQKEQAAKAGKQFDEKEAARRVNAQMMIQAAKTDLAIRTGKATARLESAMAVHEKAAAPVKDLSNTGAFKVVTPEQALENVTSKRNAATDVEQVEQISLQTAPFTRVTDEILDSVNKIMTEKETNEVTKKSVKIYHESEEETVAQQDSQTQEMPKENPYADVNPLEAITSANLANAVYQDETAVTITPHADEFALAEDGERRLSGELAKLFRKYREMPGLETQLAEYFASLDKEMRMKTSSTGNIIISGNSSSDKSDLARTIVRAINYLYPDKTRKIAKTTGDSINHRGLTKAMNKLRGTALLVEGAGSIQPKRMTEVLACLDYDTDRMIVILEDSDAEMNVLLNFNPDMTQKFNHRIVLKQYTVNELVEMARKFARKRQYEVDDDALLELYLKIDKLRSNVDNIRLDDVKEIINQAIARSEKRASRKFFGSLKKKRSENGDVIFLSEADFKD